MNLKASRICHFVQQAYEQSKKKKKKHKTQSSRKSRLPARLTSNMTHQAMILHIGEHIDKVTHSVKYMLLILLRTLQRFLLDRPSVG